MGRGERELLVSMHQALSDVGVRDADVHFILDWIVEDRRELVQKYIILGFVAFIVGIAVGLLFHFLGRI